MNKSFKKCLLQNLLTKRGTLVSMRRTAGLIVPGTIAAVTDSRCLLTPGPQLNKCMNPQIQVERSNIGKIVPNLLLACTFNLFEVRIYNEALTEAQIEAVMAIPEPATMLMLGLGGLALIRRKR